MTDQFHLSRKDTLSVDSCRHFRKKKLVAEVSWILGRLQLLLNVGLNAPGVFILLNSDLAWRNSRFILQQSEFAMRATIKSHQISGHPRR